ncbi:MAG: hypothetical protein LBR54_02775 [Oscillospiraceae bacterium]|jgi:hypothetical protein|nr:hypothetical protein [Oscillospiraceae bacterium]
MWTKEEKQAVYDLDDEAEKAGGYVEFPGGGLARHDYREMIKYCRERNMDCMDLTDEELSMFELESIYA